MHKLKIFAKIGRILRNFDASILREATLSELTGAMAKQKISNGNLLTQVMVANYEQVANFPISRGRHRRRFVRGYLCGRWPEALEASQG